MWKWLAVPLVCLTIPHLAAAQDEIIKQFSAQHLRKFINEDLKREFKVNNGDYEIVGTRFFTGLGPESKTVFFWLRIPKDLAKKPVTLDTLNTWNRAARYSRAYFVDKNLITLEGSMDLSAGVTRGQLKAFYANLEKELDEYTLALFGGLKEGPGRENPPLRVKPGTANEIIRQVFPASGDADSCKTCWDVDWDFVPCGSGAVKLFRIKSAVYSFKDREGRRKSVEVARNIQLIETFAPYDDGKTAFLDLFAKGRADLTMPAVAELKGPTCVAPAQILEDREQPKLKIYREVHDDGIRWMTGHAKAPGQNKGYRGEKLVLTSMFQAVNYVYLVEYNFTDDGRIVCRLGFTAHNFFARGKSLDPQAVNGDIHLHIGCWRMEFVLSDVDSNTGGAAKNDYRLISRRLDPATRRFKVVDEPFGADFEQREPEALEGKAKWKPEEFTTLRVVSTEAKNSHGRPIGYDLVSTRLGAVRDLGDYGDVKGEQMDFVNHDYWITQAEKALPPYHRVPKLAKGQRPLQGQQAAVWYSVPGLHVPRGEDYGPKGQQGNGVALATWIEFTLRPRELLDSTPLFP